MRQGEPLGSVMIDRRPKFSRSIPCASLLRIDTVLKYGVRAGLIRAMMEAGQRLARRWFGLLGACHTNGPKFIVNARPFERPTNFILSIYEPFGRLKNFICTHLRLYHT